MSIVSLLNVQVLNNPAKFLEPYRFEITFECLEPLKDDLEWKLVYVGASKSSKYDQELDSLLVGPVPQGVNRFVFEADPPNPDLIPQDQLVSITVMLLSCSYKGRDFVQVGYYVNNEYDSDELQENPPGRVAIDHVVRNLLAEKPRVTKYNIPWDQDESEEFPPEQPDVDADEDAYGNELDDLRDEMIDELEAGDVEVEGDSSSDEDEDGDEDGEAEAEAEGDADAADAADADADAAEAADADATEGDAADAADEADAADVACRKDEPAQPAAREADEPAAPPPKKQRTADADATTELDTTDVKKEAPAPADAES